MKRTVSPPADKAEKKAWHAPEISKIRAGTAENRYYYAGTDGVYGS